MSILAWIGSKRVTVIKCNAPQNDLSKVKKDLFLRSERLKSFRKIVKPTLVATTIVFAGMSGTFTEIPNDYNSFQQIDAVHQEIRSQITPGYDHLQKMVGKKSLTIIDKNDLNLVNIIEASDIRILPSLSYHHSRQKKSTLDMMRIDIANILKASDKIKRDTTTDILVSDPKTYSVTQSTNEKNQLGRLCFIQYGTSDYITINNGLVFSFKDIEIKAGTAIHELTHCQDVSLGKSTIKKEILADVTASLLIASHTGNWDYLDYSIGSLRILHQHDPDHASHQFLDQLKRDVDINSLTPLSQEDAFEMAKQKIADMDFDKILNQTQKDVLINQHYNYVVNDDLKWDGLSWGDTNDYVRYGVTSEAEFQTAMENHGNKKMEVYLNHMNYKALEDSSVVVEGIFKHMYAHAETFGDHTMKKLVNNQIEHFNQHNIVDLNKISDTLGYDLNKDARERFFGNMKVMRPVFLDYQPQPKTLVINASFNDPEVPSLIINNSAQDTFLKKLDIKSTHGYDY